MLLRNAEQAIDVEMLLEALGELVESALDQQGMVMAAAYGANSLQQGTAQVRTSEQAMAIGSDDAPVRAHRSVVADTIETGKGP